MRKTKEDFAQFLKSNILPKYYDNIVQYEQNLGIVLKNYEVVISDDTYQCGTYIIIVMKISENGGCLSSFSLLKNEIALRTGFLNDLVKTLS
jgi:hypothetical protein